MESCPSCGSTDLVGVEDYDCYACDLMECEECGDQFRREEIRGVDHDDDCEAMQPNESVRPDGGVS